MAGGAGREEAAGAAGAARPGSAGKGVAMLAVGCEAVAVAKVACTAWRAHQV